MTLHPPPPLKNFLRTALISSQDTWHRKCLLMKYLPIHASVISFLGHVQAQTFSSIYKVATEMRPMEAYWRPLYTQIHEWNYILLWLRVWVCWQFTLSIITTQLHFFQLRTILDGKDFKFFSHGLCTEKQNILLQHMREKFFWFWSMMEISINTKTRLMTWSQPRFRVKAYFNIYWTK